MNERGFTLADFMNQPFANAKDNGNRKFILVEGEEYADKLTAERVRRAIKGYAWAGNQRETLLEEKINFTQFKKAGEWLQKVDAIKAKEGVGAAESAQILEVANIPETFEIVGAAAREFNLALTGTQDAATACQKGRIVCSPRIRLSSRHDIQSQKNVYVALEKNASSATSRRGRRRACSGRAAAAAGADTKDVPHCGQNFTATEPRAAPQFPQKRVVSVVTAVPPA
jgi:hypothetical protein